MLNRFYHMSLQQSVLYWFQVCSWAVHTVKSLGSLDWDDYDEMEEVINWMMAVISFNLFLNDDDCAGEWGNT